MGLSRFLTKVATDPKAQDALRSAATKAQQLAGDPATRARVESTLADLQRRWGKRR